MITTVVNDTDVKLLDCQIGTERETATRRAAASLDRGDETVDHVSPNVGGRVNVWLAGTDGFEGDRSIRFVPPKGWQIAYTDVTTSGSVCATIERVDA